ncbi:MAG: hypothetical protein IKQ88_03075 [Lachnospiraceae bacterium]|nr:hypothetical protein [Lachnospiraceae bacterium]
MIRHIKKENVPALIIEVFPEDTADEGVFICAKISSCPGGRDMYPELLTDIKLPLCIIAENEESIVKEYTYGSVLNRMFYEKGICAAYREALKEYRPSAVLLLAVCGDADKTDIEERFFKAVINPDTSGEADADFEEKLIRDIRASRAMSEEIRRLIIYDRLAGTGLKDIVKRMYGDGMLPCNDKREGKTVLAVLRHFCEQAPVL